MDDYLDCKDPNHCNGINRAAQSTVVRLGGVIFPDRSRIFNSGNLCYVLHNSDVSKVDNMPETPGDL